MGRSEIREAISSALTATNLALQTIEADATLGLHSLSEKSDPFAKNWESAWIDIGGEG